MKTLIAISLLIPFVSYSAHLGERIVTGIVKSFDSKSVTIEQNGRKLQFRIDRVIGPNKIIIGKPVQISLENSKIHK